jgi:hypothetical protein
MLWSKAIAAGGAGGAGGDLLSISSVYGNITWDGSTPLDLSLFGEYTVIPLKSISVATKMWGAGGACGFDYQEGITSTNRQGPGGGGGYAYAIINLVPENTYVFQVGQGGIRTTATSAGATYLAGGIGTTNGGTQGGGYSGVFKNSVTQANALLMAGGGGGGGDLNYAWGASGAGGGASGLDWSGGPLPSQGGGGGTQSAGGYSSSYNGATAGVALTGGKGQNNERSLGGGGGGYFGGGGGNVGGGGGGSGRIGTDATVTSGLLTAGSASTPGNSTDTARGTAGNGGVSGTTSGVGGKIRLTLI